MIEENKDIYYKSLRRTQTTLKSNDPAGHHGLDFSCVV